MNYKKELQLLKEHQNGEEMGLWICDKAEAVMDLITSQGHSGLSFSLLSNILKRFLDDKPLFPLTNDVSEWGTLAGEDQNNRYSSLFRYTDGTYTDVSRVIFVDTYDNKNTTWTNGNATRIVDEMFPITLPYMPDEKSYYIYGKDMFLDKDGNDITKENIGSYNYTVFDYLITPDGKRIELNRVFDEREN